ncbi:MAG TPA: YkgJ family cysteine cluster protein [Pseudothermotoga sp.]|nr:YkgJ family cysteine cluster protein [Pseudothermotoga sp.]HOK82927.1 YkgJ family cysteine cluster protein [Pseudothermotoga sp.]HPP69899.1 YkgJ family cysteine cluster protein [Pseudothermotoga sp.]
MTERITLLAQEVLNLYAELEKCQSNLFSCPQGCRICCNTPAYNIEVTILEFLPLAIHLIDSNQSDWIERIERSVDDEPCVLFQPDMSLKPEGGCLFHQFRPLVCRLFGASFTVRKDQKQVLACRLLRQKVQQSIHLLPSAQDYNTRLISIDFFLAKDTYGINTALRKAVEYAGLYYTPLYPARQIKSA